ncbi:MAG: hypothetical protein ACYTGG_06455 [Planctomycetota bacterium]|jgi:hypothetical protein
MNRQRLIAILASFAVLVNGLALPALAADGPVTWTAAEEAAYAEREAESTHVETFAGGDSTVVVILAIVVIAFLVWYFIHNEYGIAAATPEETEAVMLGEISACPDSSFDESRPADITCDDA